MNINKYHILIITFFVCCTTFSFAHEGATGIIKEVTAPFFGIYATKELLEDF